MLLSPIATLQSQLAPFEAGTVAQQPALAALVIGVALVWIAANLGVLG